MIKNNKKIIHAWCLYDWANSVYSLTITSAIFPIYYQSATKNEISGDIVNFFGIELINSVLYSYSISFSLCIVAFILPLLTGLADYSGNKKKFLEIFMFLGSISCMLLFFFRGENVEWGIMCSIFASIGFSGSLVFYNAFLNEITTPDKREAVSAKGYTYGYIGGVILLMINLWMIEKHDFFALEDKSLASRVSFLTVGIWWMFFSLYALRRIPENVKIDDPKKIHLLDGYKKLKNVYRGVKKLKFLKRFLCSYFFYNMGVQTVMYLAATFGSKELKIEEGNLILTILAIQFLGALGAYFFAFLSKKTGNITTLKLLITIWMFTCIYAFFVIQPLHFYLLAAVIGFVMGGIQSLSRATYSKLIPRTTVNTASYFSFYDVLYNLSVVFGTLTYGLVEEITGSMRNSTLFLAGFFVVGLLFIFRVQLKNEVS